MLVELEGIPYVFFQKRISFKGRKSKFDLISLKFSGVTITDEV